jgi:hypothetical protein
VKKVVRRILLLLAVVIVVTRLYIATIFSGGIKGLWYDLTKPDLDPNSTLILNKRTSAKDKIVQNFDYLDFFPSTTRYGIHNTDICSERKHSHKNPMSISSHLYTCKYISQRYYGLEGEYESSVRALIAYITKNKEGLSFQDYQTEQLFVQKDWLSHEPTTDNIIAQHNLRNPTNQVSAIREIVSFIESKKENTVYTYSQSDDGYTVKLDFFDEGTSPSSTEGGNIYEESDTPDLRDAYITQIKENHPYGVVVTVSYTYYQK